MLRFVNYIVALYMVLEFPVQKRRSYHSNSEYSFFYVQAVNDAPYGMIDKVLTDCEYEGLNVGSELADEFNAMDEATEFDVRVHSDYCVEHMGFAGLASVKFHNLKHED